MRIVIIGRDCGKYTDSINHFDLIEIPYESHVATNNPVIEFSSANDYAQSMGWATEENEC